MPSNPKQCPPSLPTCASLAHDHLEPIRAFVHSQHGMMARLAQKMSEMTSTPVTRQVLSRWLHRDPKKRQEPKLGAFLVMQAAVRSLQTEKQSAGSAEA